MSKHTLFVDIETAPLLIWAWGVYEQNAIDVKASWYMLSFAYKWQGERTVKTRALPDYKNFKKDKEDDSALAAELHALYDDAKVVIAHNGDRFDLKKSNARFIKHGMPPPSPYQSIDTLKLAKKHFAFSSNKLNDLGAYLGVGRKLPHTGFHLWKGCMTGDPKSWSVMRRYNARDVELLERVYERLKPWSTTHPNMARISGHGECPICASEKTIKRGVKHYNTRSVQQHKCLDCHAWFFGKNV